MFIAVSSYKLYEVRGCCMLKDANRRTETVSGYKSHKEIDFGSKLALPALLADFRYNRPNLSQTQVKILF